MTKEWKYKTQMRLKPQTPTKTTHANSKTDDLNNPCIPASTICVSEKKQYSLGQNNTTRNSDALFLECGCDVDGFGRSDYNWREIGRRLSECGILPMWYWRG